MSGQRRKGAAKDTERVVRTFLFTDLAKSTDIRNRCIQRLGEHQGNERFREEVLRPHDQRVEECVRTHGGEVVSTAGDSYFVAFRDAREAIECAVAIQRSLISNPIAIPVMGGDLPAHVQVKIGMHTAGATQLLRAEQPNYDDETINIAHRIQECAHGEQVLVS